MSDSEGDSDYDVEEYIKPTIKRTTYDEEEEEKHISEQENSDDDNKSEASSEKSEEVFDCSKKEVITVPEKVKVIAKLPPKVEEIEEPVRTSCRLILHVSNLTVEVTKSMLEAFFMGSGEIKSIRLPKRRAKNLAFVEMRDMEGYKVKIFIKMNFY